MRLPNIRVLQLLLIACIPGSTLCQTDINGIINKYEEVVLIKPDSGCGTFVRVKNASFVAGDLVLIMQMQGATFDKQDLPSFGSIISEGGAGTYEYNRVAWVSGTAIHLAFKLLRNYDV